MKFFLLLSALLLPLVSQAAPACWRACTAKSKSTSVCVNTCGVSGRAEFDYCHAYCGKRGGHWTTCTSLCNPGGRNGDDEISDEERRRNDEAMDRNICESSGRCRDRTPSDRVPQDDNDRAMDRNRCLSGGDCVRP